MVSRAQAGEEQGTWTSYWAPEEAISNAKLTGILNIPHYGVPKAKPEYIMSSTEGTKTKDSTKASNIRSFWRKAQKEFTWFGMNEVVPSWSQFTQTTTFHGVKYIFQNTGFSLRRSVYKQLIQAILSKQSAKYGYFKVIIHHSVTPRIEVTRRMFILS